MISSPKPLVLAGIVLFTMAATSCSSGSNASSPSGASTPSAPPTAVNLATAADQPLTLTPAQLLAATGGATPVAFASPAHGKVSYGAGGTMVYTPEKGFSGTDELKVTTAEAVQLYAVDTPPIATVGGVAIESSADGSAIATVPGSTDEIYGLSDRGPNVDGRTDDEKVLPVPDFQPRINEYKLSDGTATVEKTIGLTGTDGAPLRGLVDPQANTGETLVDINGKPLPTSDHGLDTEGLVALPDGTFWVSDEYGPFLVHFDATGKEVERLSPFTGSLPRELSLRTPNQGMEGLTITPDGSTLVGIMQSALKTPGLEGSAKSVAFTRIVTVNLATKAVGEYLYPLANPQKTKVAVSEITALTNTTFLVDERDGKLAPGADKKVYVADISGATDVGPKASVPGATYDPTAGGLQVGGKALETAIGVTTDAEAVAALKAKGITTVAKTLKLDLGGLLTELNAKGEFFGHDKVEGLATADGGNTLTIANDSDFGLAGLASETPPFALKPKTLANGRQDTGEFLVVDTTKLPAKTQTTTVSIKVGT
jgi:phytase-like protein/Big-like domain-containing protein